MDPVPPRAQLVQQVYDRLLQAICSRRLAPGSRIAQEQLAASLGVSRQPVSHALQLLKQQGLVRDAGGRGLVVAPIEADYVHALYEVRAALDAIAAARAARRVGEVARGARQVGAVTRAAPPGAGAAGMPSASPRRARSSNGDGPPRPRATRPRWPMPISPFTASSTSLRPIR